MIANILYSADMFHNAAQSIHRLITQAFAERGEPVKEYCLVGDGPNPNPDIAAHAISSSRVVRGKGVWKYIPGILTAKISALLRDNSVDLVICDGLGVTRPLLRVLARMEHLRLIVVLHGNVRLRPRDAAALNAYAERIRIVTVSKQLAGVICSNYPDLCEIVRAVPNTIAPDFPQHLFSREEARAILGLPSEGELVAVSSRLVEKKHIELVLSAFAKHSSRQRYLVIMGNGPERRKLEALAEALHISSRTIWLGWVPDASRYLKAFDLFVSASEAEGFGLSVLEAYAAGLPVVCSDIDAHRELLGDHASYFGVSDVDCCASLLSQVSVPVEPCDVADRFSVFAQGYRTIRHELCS